MVREFENTTLLLTPGALTQIRCDTETQKRYTENSKREEKWEKLHRDPKHMQTNMTDINLRGCTGGESDSQNER